MTVNTLELRKIAPLEWIIQDLTYPIDDSRNVVAHITETEDDLVEVVWLQNLALPTLYLFATDVLEDVVRHRTAGGRSRRPSEIPHLPPLSARRERPQVV
ncbi:hypothetical protein ACFUTX_15435 [Microbacterium sp. NPDC057407]|uniref:hypothetical protein n=1 Tax=Microbacterium sp. NPDC057407 TaxID=3346120 RepID=UPI00367182EB